MINCQLERNMVTFYYSPGKRFLKAPWEVHAGMN